MVGGLTFKPTVRGKEQAGKKRKTGRSNSQIFASPKTRFDDVYV